MNNHQNINNTNKYKRMAVNIENSYQCLTGLGPRPSKGRYKLTAQTDRSVKLSAAVSVLTTENWLEINKLL